MKKKILSLILAVAMIFTMMPAAFAGQSNFADLADLLPGSKTVTGLFLQVLNGGLLGKEDGLQEIKDLIDTQYDKKHQTAGYVADENSYYVSLGDSTITGIATGDPAYGNYGYKTKVPTSAPYQVAAALGVEYQQLAMAGLRTTDLRYILDAGFTPDEYAQKVTTQRINTYAGGIDQMRKDYLTELQKADLITVAIGNCNFSDFVKAQLFGSISDLINGQLGGLVNGYLGGTIKSALSSYGIDLSNTTYRMDWEGYLGKEGADELKASLEEVEAALIEGGLPANYQVNLAELIGLSLNPILQSKLTLNIPMAELMCYYMECFLYGYVTFVTDFEAAFDKIHEIAPEAELLVLGMYNPADELAFSFGEAVIPFGEYYGYIAKVMSMYFADYAKNTKNTTFVDVYDTQSKADAAGGTYDLMEYIMSFSSKIEEFYATAEGHTYMKNQIVAALAPQEEVGLKGDADGSGEVDYVDAMIVLQYHTGVVGDDALDLAVCDVDDSGEVDYVDAMVILQYHTGVIDEL